MTIDECALIVWNMTSSRVMHQPLRSEGLERDQSFSVIIQALSKVWYGVQNMKYYTVRYSAPGPIRCGVIRVGVLIPFLHTSIAFVYCISDIYK